MFRQRAVSPAVITGYTLLLHINTYFHKITWGDIIDMCHAAYYIFSFFLIMVSNFFGSEVSPLTGTADSFFRVKVLYGVAQGIESDSAVGTY